MIIHNCIKCNNVELIPMAVEPCIQRYFCPICGEEQWIYHSRIEPKTYPKDKVKILPNGEVEISED